MPTRAARIALLALLTLPVFPGQASAESLRVEYGIAIRGLPIGRGSVTAGVEGGRYTLAFAAGANTLTRLVSSATVAASATGRLENGSLRPAEYEIRWDEDGETEKVGLHFEGSVLKGIALDPPRSHPERYVPIPDAEKRNIRDPLSLFLWPTPAGLSPAACAGSLRLVDGKRRFDFDLAYGRTERFAAGDFSAEAVVCAIRYRQIAGHRIGRIDRNPILDADGMEIWLAPATPALAVPVRLVLQTGSGRVVLKAREVEVR